MAHTSVWESARCVISQVASANPYRSHIVLGHVQIKTSTTSFLIIITVFAVGLGTTHFVYLFLTAVKHALQKHSAKSDDDNDDYSSHHRHCTKDGCIKGDLQEADIVEFLWNLERTTCWCSSKVEAFCPLCDVASALVSTRTATEVHSTHLLQCDTNK